MKPSAANGGRAVTRPRAAAGEPAIRPKGQGAGQAAGTPALEVLLPQFAVDAERGAIGPANETE